MSGPLLEVNDLSVSFETPRGRAHVVSGLTYRVDEGETLAIVGESGSGKSVHALSLLGLLDRRTARIDSGSVRFAGRELIGLPERDLRAVRGREIGFVFQDPATSLNPFLTIGTQIGETLVAHLGVSRRQARDRAIELLDTVGISPARERIDAYPHQLSGGQRQRVMIAIAVACEPKLLIADEATTALDVSIQAQIIELLGELKRRMNLSILWISHDLGVVAGFADKVQVMYAGRIQERGSVDDIFHDPRSAYTLGLLRSLPETSFSRDRLYSIPGHPPDPVLIQHGDPFAPRNPYATERCFLEQPPLAQVADGGPDHLAAAWYDLRAAVALEKRR